MNNDLHEIRYSMTYRDAVRILELVKSSTELTSLSFECGDLKLAVERSSERAARAPAQKRGPDPVAPASPSAEASVPRARNSTSEVRAEDEQFVTIRAPLLGTFYCTSAPGEPPYVVVGQRISADDTIGLIEVMKLFTSVSAGVNGIVEEIVAVHGEMVEYDQPLVRVRPK
ncbi:biotin/lipoyl-containing protein [Bradyrhizobium sp. B097]|uniref:acetyl-CoA carboxylase biotin carboxyl carrier protein n=1 Tax=Bradyrhizobium sp. B097 TaxID=3140244 RepID=UPI003183A9C1